ncbi:hypothetical protein V7O66_03650 [Methanolobus sp. ZRKC3]|uniref:hypothetical protein n=1 Tax=Methanolobus sp. ZRKC3 TaxID=3125786 RepID=UPI003254BD94
MEVNKVEMQDLEGNRIETYLDIKIIFNPIALKLLHLNLIGFLADIHTSSRLQMSPLKNPNIPFKFSFWVIYVTKENIA